MFDLHILTSNGAVMTQNTRDGLKKTGRHGVLDGLIMANNTTDPTNDLDVGAGRARSENGTREKILELSATNVKQLDVVFAEYVAIGTPSGGRDTADNLTGAKWFNVYLIGGTGKNDQIFFSTSAAPTLPGGFTDRAYIGRIYWDGAAIKPFTMDVGGDPDFVQWTTPPLDVSIANPGATRQTPSVTAPAGSLGMFRVGLLSAATDAAILWVGATAEGDAAPSKTASPLAVAEVAAGEDQFIGPFAVPVDSSRQIGYRLSNSTANITVRLLTVGYRDLRRRR